MQVTVDVLEKNILFLARENASIYDVLIEIRQDHQEDKTFSGLMRSFQYTYAILENMYEQQKIAFYDDVHGHVDFKDNSINIYTTFLCVV